MANQTEDPALASRFATVADSLEANEEKILAELNDAQGVSMDVGGYYMPNDDLASAAMRPSATLNGIIDAVAPESAIRWIRFRRGILKLRACALLAIGIADRAGGIAWAMPDIMTHKM